MLLRTCDAQALDTLEVKYQKELPGNAFGLNFYVIKPMKAAFFVRNNTLWVVFDEKLSLSDEKVARFKSAYIESVQRFPSEDGTILQVNFKNLPDKTYGLKVIKRDTIWQLIISPTTFFRIKPLILDVKVHADTRMLDLLFKKQSKLIQVADPVNKDYLYVMPTDESGVELGYRYVQFDVLKSQNGFVIASPSKNLNIKSIDQGVRLTFDEKKFFISSNKDRTYQRSQSGLESYFKHIHYRQPDETNWIHKRQSLYNQLAHHSGTNKDALRHQLISLYLSTHNYEEAIGQIDQLMHLEEAGKILLKGIFYALSGQNSKASSYLYDSALDLIPETHLWRGYTDSLQGNYKSAFDKVIRNLKYFQSYPAAIKNKLALESAHASLQIGFSGKLFFNMINASYLRGFDVAYYDFLRGLEFFMDKENKKAKEFLTKASQSPYRKIQILSNFSLIRLESHLSTPPKLKKNTPEFSHQKELEYLETLQYEWRYDDLECKVLIRLFELYAQKKEASKALDKLTTLFEYFPDMDERIRLADAGEEIFKAECLHLLRTHPIEGIAFYNRYLNFMPIDEDKIEIYKELVAALRSLHLYKKGVTLLNQILKTLSDQEVSYSEISIEIAQLLYDGGNPKDALNALARLEKRATLPPGSNLQQNKDLIKAKCYIELEKYEDAHQLLKDLASQQSKEILIRIAWRQENWVKAAELMKEYVNDSGSGHTQLTAKFIIEYATALSQANKLRELIDLDRQYGVRMRSSVYAREFQLLINPRKSA